MSKKRTLRQVAVAVMLLVALLCQGTWALAGTTGGLSGSVTDESGAPVAGADVKVVSASESSSVKTDNSGHFAFLSLAPDTYTLSVEKTGFNPVSYAGVSVFADNQQSLGAIRINKALKEIAKVSARSAGALVKAGTTSDVYSVNAATAAKVTGLGGGGSLDQAYSAIATMPGAYVPVGQAGWYQSVYIRGGDYDQVGYEVDGVPVNRAFDNYPANTASALGQQEVQVYTGANPANSEGQGLSGFINQVIKTGTHPGFATSDLALGSPIFYHKANIEVGGASPDRMFSYYVGLGAYNQAYRSYDQSEGAGLQKLWGTPFTNCPATAPAGFTLPGCYNDAGVYTTGTGQLSQYVLGPFNYNALSLINDRENVANFHFAIPHHHDAGRDDLQVLWQASDLKTAGNDRPADWGNPAFYAAAGMTPATFAFAHVYTGPVGKLVPVSAGAAGFAPVVPYGYPSAPSTLALGGVIPQYLNDSVDNAVGIVKLQYQKNFSSDAYLRVYGYSVYSNWFNWGPNSTQDFFSGGVSTDYELFTHTTGFSGTFAKQLNSRNLLQVQGSYSQATSTRSNNLTPLVADGTRMATLVDSTNPLSGVCYTTAGAPGNCDGGRKGGAKGALIKVGTLYCAQNPGDTNFCGPTPVTLPTVTAATCGSGPCAWYVADTGYTGKYNSVKPKFTSGSITDEWDPTERLHLNLGVRYDRYQYDPANTNFGARTFWLNSWNNSYCYGTTVGFVERNMPAAAGGVCPAGTAPAIVDNNSKVQSYTVLQPRVAFTYTVNPLNVLRFSYGKYDQAPNAAFEQYNNQEQNFFYSNRNFYQLGFTSPTHPVRPEISYNTDFSWEHQVKGTDMSWKVTPFYRKTSDQIQNFFLDVKTGFVSGLNVGAQTSRGVEFQFQKGDFSKNGLAALLSYTYTYATVKYSPAPNGATPVTGINQAIQQYNAWTSACAGGSTATQYGMAMCGSTGSAVAAPCYTTAGAPLAAAACVAGTISNPYWNAPVQGLLDPNGQYQPYSQFPANSPGAGDYSSYVVPHVATLVLNYKHDKFAIAPALQFSAGRRYGYPGATTGIDPSTCTGFLAGATAGDPRFPYGGAGSPFDAGTCGTGPSIPNPATGKFDGIGAFSSPSRLTMSAQMSYELNPHVNAVLTLSNIVDTCFGGTSTAWSTVPGVPKNKVCGFNAGYTGVGIPPAGNLYNPPFSSVQAFQRQSYTPSLSTLPFNAYFDLKIKL